MSIWAIVAMSGVGGAGVKAQVPTPALWLTLNGEVLVNGRAAEARITPGASKAKTPNGVAFNFNGVRGGVLLKDLPALQLAGSMTVSAWLYPRSYVNDGPGAQLLFRGDDRSGLDPYDFVVLGDGTVNFGIQDEQHQGMSVKAELPLHRWTHVTASFNAQTGELRMYLNGDLAAYSITSKRPFLGLDPHTAPGIGIGNVQNDAGPHNQPYNGMIADLRLYSSVLTPDQTGFTGPTRRTDPSP